MRHLLVAVPKTALYSAAAASCVVSVAASSSSTLAASPMVCALRWQSQSRSYGGRGGGSGGGGYSGNGGSGGSRSFVAGRGGGGGFNSNRGGGRPSSSAAGGDRSDAGQPLITNKTNDGDLSFGTRVAMRDDSIILTEICKHLPPQGAISIKSLFSALNPDVQEALCEKHNGLRSFVEQRKQIFTVRPHPTDGVLYVVGNPLVAQQYATRDVQLQTMRQVMGLTDDDLAFSTRQRQPGSNFGNGRGGSRGGANTNYNGNRGDSYGGNNDGRRRPPQQRDDRRSYGGNSRSYNNNNNSNNNSGPPPGREPRPMGSSRTASFGNRN